MVASVCRLYTKAEIPFLFNLSLHRPIQIDFENFLGLMAKKINEASDDNDILEAFIVFDKNGDGRISEGNWHKKHDRVQ